MKRAVSPPVQKAKQASRQATRKVQQSGGPSSLKEVLNEDTGSTVGAVGVFGLAVVVAGALILEGDNTNY